MTKRVFLALAAAAVVAATIYLWPTGRSGYALAELSVGNMTCGACVGKVEASLEAVGGTGAVDVSVTGGRVSVEFDPGAVDAGALAAALTRAGYPAESVRVVPAADYRRLRQDESLLAERYVGRIGKRLVSRDEFEREVALLRELRPPAGSGAEDVLRSRAWQELTRRELLLGAAAAADIVVPEALVERERQRLQAADPALFATLESRLGGEATLRLRLKEELSIRQLMQSLVGSEPEPFRQQERFSGLLRQQQERTPVVVYDPQLKAAATQGTGGCGGKCCG